MQTWGPPESVLAPPPPLPGALVLPQGLLQKWVHSGGSGRRLTTQPLLVLQVLHDEGHPQA